MALKLDLRHITTDIKCPGWKWLTASIKRSFY